MQVIDWVLIADRLQIKVSAKSQPEIGAGRPETDRG